MAGTDRTVDLGGVDAATVHHRFQVERQPFRVQERSRPLGQIVDQVLRELLDRPRRGRIPPWLRAIRSFRRMFRSFAAPGDRLSRY